MPATRSSSDDTKVRDVCLYPAAVSPRNLRHSSSDTPEQRSETQEPSSTEIRRRATAGFAVVVSWSLVSLIVAFFGNVALARLLTPTDFGIFAVGSTVLLITAAFAEGGLGSGLVRRPEPPSRAELRTLQGVQLALTGLVAALIVLIAMNFGATGRVVATMACALPLASLQSPGRLVLNRAIRLRAASAVEMVAVVLSYAWSITGAALGFGVWALATGTVVRATVGSLAMAVVPGAGLHRPSLRGLRAFAPIIRFGARFQATWFVIVVRDQLVNVAIGARGDVHVLGLWSLATRLMLVPATIPESLSRVVYPMFSRTLSAGEDPSRTIARMARLGTIAAALTFPPFVASSVGLVPIVFGEQWNGVAEVLPIASLGVLLTTAILPVGIGYLFAADRPTVVLRAITTGAVLWLGATIALVPALGATAGAVGWVLGIVGEAGVVAVSVRKAALINMLRPVAAPALIAIGAAVTGVVAAHLLGPTLAASLVSGALAFFVALGALTLFDRTTLTDFVSVGRRSLRGALAR